MKRLVLASASPTRARMLEAAGLLFDTVPADLDEDTIRQKLEKEENAPSAIALALAEAKAAKVSQTDSAALAIGADQLLVLDGEIVAKASDLAVAEAILRRLRGRGHQLISAAALVSAGKVLWRGVDQATLEMRPFSDAFLADYMAEEGEALLGTVGCYRLEGPGAQLFARVAGDHFTILGLPLLPLLSALRAEGILRI